MLSIDDYESTDPIAWCPGCGNFAILKALKQALVAAGRSPHEVVISSGIGQAAKTPHYLRCNTFNGLHGRSLPVAQAVKLANHELTVLAEGGDGDGYTEGGNHFLHAMRRNVDITYLVHDNQVYGLTKGQTSATSEQGYVSKTTPHGAYSPPLNPLAVAIAAGCSFVARGFSGDIEHLSGLIQAAIAHKGFALIDILQPCVSFNKINTFRWYKERVYRLGAEYDAGDKGHALALAAEWGERIPIGIIYQCARPTRNELEPALQHTPLVHQQLDPTSLAALIQQHLDG